jgi:hypothetical protein
MIGVVVVVVEELVVDLYQVVLLEAVLRVHLRLDPADLRRLGYRIRH